MFGLRAVSVCLTFSSGESRCGVEGNAVHGGGQRSSPAAHRGGHAHLQTEEVQLESKEVLFTVEKTKTLLKKNREKHKTWFTIKL